MIRTTLSVALLTLSVAAAADIYKWSDASQFIHYTEVPPAHGIPYQIVKESQRLPTPAQPTATLDQERKDLAKAGERAEQQQKDREEAKDLRADNARASDNCERAQHNLETLQAHTQVIMQDPESGISTRLSEQQRNAQIRQSEKDIQYYCES